MKKLLFLMLPAIFLFAPAALPAQDDDVGYSINTAVEKNACCDFQLPGVETFVLSPPLTGFSLAVLPDQPRITSPVPIHAKKWMRGKTSNMTYYFRNADRAVFRERGYLCRARLTSA